jgi:NADH-quinone oxidoreductase subunit C
MREQLFAGLLERLKRDFSEEIISFEEHHNQKILTIKKERIPQILELLKEDPNLRFEYLVDICGVDYLGKKVPSRFAVVYILYSFKQNLYLRLKTFVDEKDPFLDSASRIYPSADWAEREIYDMFGIVFKNHPGLQRILLPDNFEGHPLRKDFPLKGYSQRENLPKLYEIE